MFSKITASTGIITTVAGDGAAGFAGDNAAGTAAKLFSAEHRSRCAGNLYIADTDNERIRRVDAATASLPLWPATARPDMAGWPSRHGVNHRAQSARSAGLRRKRQLVYRDAQNNRIRAVSASTGIITTVAGSGVVGDTGDGASAKAAELDAPSGLAVDPAGNIYIADTQNNAIRKVSSASGLISTIARNNAGEYYFAGAFSFVSIYGPVGLFLDGSANLYFADSLNMVVARCKAIMRSRFHQILGPSGKQVRYAESDG